MSNFTLELLQRVVEMGKVLPAVNQVRIPIPSLPAHPLSLPGLPGALRNAFADQPPPIQLCVVEGRLGIFCKARHRDRSIWHPRVRLLSLPIPSLFRERGIDK